MTSGGSTAAIALLSLGDSYTIGEGVEAAERWPNQLVDALRSRGLVVADPAIIARTGWTTDELSAAIDNAPPRATFDLVTLLIGVNDQYRGRAPAEYRGRFRSLLERAIAFAANVQQRVIVVSIPDWGVTPFAHGHDRSRIAAGIDAYNAINRDETRRGGAHYVDVTSQSRAAATDPSLLADDGLHPSARMYERWAQLVLPVAERAITATAR